MSAPNSLPTLRWGIVATGWISTMFTSDLLVQRSDAKAKHHVAAVGSSSVEKGNTFVEKVWKDSQEPRPKVYGDYQGVYNDPNVDIVYVGTPHSLHKQNCLDAIAAGKHVLCEKPFTINERDTQEVVDAARAKGVFIMEALWTRFFPLMSSLLDHLYTKKTIGDIQRLFVDFATKMPLATLPAESRLKDPALGAGALLDVGIYTLTYASVLLGEGKVGAEHPQPAVTSTLNIINGIDDEDVVVLKYPASKDGGPPRTAVCTSSLNWVGSRDFARIEGSDGKITIFGLGPSVPGGFRIQKGGNPQPMAADTREPEETFNFEQPAGAIGFFHEADAVALDIAAGRKENAIMPLDESLRMFRLMDSIRRTSGLVYPQDQQ